MSLLDISYLLQHFKTSLTTYQNIIQLIILFINNISNNRCNTVHNDSNNNDYDNNNNDSNNNATNINNNNNNTNNDILNKEYNIFNYNIW